MILKIIYMCYHYRSAILMNFDFNRFISDIKTLDSAHVVLFFTLRPDNIDTNSDLCKFNFRHENRDPPG